MGALCTGFERWGGLGMSNRFCGSKGDQDRLRPQKLDEFPPDLAAWPITPAYRLS